MTWVLGEWLGPGLVVDLRLLASGSHETVAAAAVAAVVAGKGSWLEGSSAGPGRRN